MRPTSSGLSQQSQTGRTNSTIMNNSIPANSLLRQGRTSRKDTKDTKVKSIITMGYSFLFLVKVRRSIKKRKHR